MVKASSPKGFPALRRISQKTDSHCGPAVVTMLASYIGVRVIQHDIVKAAGAVKTYRERGMTVAELATGLLRLKPDLLFYYKTRATLDDLDMLVNVCLLPVGVEWQGEFGEYADEDNGHYSVVTAVSRTTGTIDISDPFSVYAGRDRTFPIPEFLARWWDVNETFNTKTGTMRPRKDLQMMFAVTSPETTLPKTIGLRQFRPPGE